MTPVFLPSPCQVTLVLVAMQMADSFGKFGMLGVTDVSAPSSGRLISKTQRELLDPQVFAAEHSCSGEGSSTPSFCFSYLSLFAPMPPSSSNTAINSKIMLDPMALNRLRFT